MVVSPKHRLVEARHIYSKFRRFVVDKSPLMPYAVLHASLSECPTIPVLSDWMPRLMLIQLRVPRASLDDKCSDFFRSLRCKGSDKL
ncbi:hypothetical protein JTE90_010114 [Oedothorax gibbosus]|uniref:Uncharacterized protein n=1 Tax=Oedothorax gibbosus TaxID=931172 RepID=A0AAV6UET7_9ARAC|nr:hypothetical protein JTE90_010114 [Oedothorax gibbosus]